MSRIVCQTYYWGTCEHGDKCLDMHPTKLFSSPLHICKIVDHNPYRSFIYDITTYDFRAFNGIENREFVIPYQAGWGILTNQAMNYIIGRQQEFFNTGKIIWLMKSILDDSYKIIAGYMINIELTRPVWINFL
jgi:hypothetical protein